MWVQKLVMWEVNRLEKTAHLTHKVPPAALPGGRAPDGRRLLSYRPKTATLTGPVYTRCGRLVPRLCVSISRVCGCMRNCSPTHWISKKVKVQPKCKHILIVGLR